MAPHPAVAEVRRAVREHLRRLGQGRALVACSGGADSLSLAAATAFVAPRLGIAAGLGTVDHGLQPGTATQAQRVAAIGADLGLDPVEIVPVAVGTAGGPEAAARTARYAALDAVAAALDAQVLLGHTLDDQAETVLLGLGRGSGPRSIAGMRARQGRWSRPFLGVRRSTTAAACAALGLESWTDPHNADPAYQRVRLRTEVLPLLEEVLRGGVAEALARTAALLQDDLDAVDALADGFGMPQRCPDPTIACQSLDAGERAGTPRAIRTRLLRAWARSNGAGPLSAERTAALDALITDWHGQGPVDLPGGVRVIRASGKLVVSPSVFDQE
jgi:tRNA(Ile)-lysidine synthase